MNLYINDKLIRNKYTIETQSVKHIFLIKWFGETNNHIQKSENEKFSYTTYKNISKLLKSLRLKL